MLLCGEGSDELLGGYERFYEAALRRYGFEVQRILNGILMFYACVQKEDVDAAAVPTEKPFRFETTVKANTGGAPPSHILRMMPITPPR